MHHPRDCAVLLTPPRPASSSGCGDYFSTFSFIAVIFFWLGRVEDSPWCPRRPSSLLVFDASFSFSAIN
jgi:hypothetical protein